MLVTAMNTPFYELKVGKNYLIYRLWSMASKFQLLLNNFYLKDDDFDEVDQPVLCPTYPTVTETTGKISIQKYSAVYDIFLYY